MADSNQKVLVIFNLEAGKKDPADEIHAALTQHFVAAIAQRELGLLDRMYADDVAGRKAQAGLS